MTTFQSAPNEGVCRVQYLPAKMIARKNDRWAAAGGSFFPAEMIARKNDRFPATGGKQFTPQK